MGEQAFTEALETGRAALRQIAVLATDLDAAMEARDRAVAKAWKHGPPGMSWADLHALLMADCPKAAKVTVHALRHGARRANGGWTPRKVDL